MLTFSQMILNLQQFWYNKGCNILQPYDVEAGAGTFHPATTLRTMVSDDWACAYVAPSRRPTDSRYGQNPNRLGAYYQFQVLIKPSPDDIQELYLQSLQILGIDLKKHDVRFVEDNWESPTLGAWGLGWEVWLDGMEVTQFTYFQQVGGFDCSPVAAEITYGLERLAVYLQDVDNVFDIVWSNFKGVKTLYRDLHKVGEYEFSKYNFEVADPKKLFRWFEDYSSECRHAIEASLPLPAYDYVLKASHVFNILDARKVISQASRQDYILKIRELTHSVMTLYKLQEKERQTCIKG